MTVQPLIVCCGGGSAPSAYSLSTANNQVATSWEPSDGTWPNAGYINGQPSPSTDDSGHSYYDHDFFDLCGPGAVDMALEYWPSPPNSMYSTNVNDPAYQAAHGGTPVYTSWTNERYRGYMTYIAWQINIPNSIQFGIMDQYHYPSWGVTLQSEANAMNWEASNRNTSTWQNYFYVVAWWNQNDSPTLLHNDIVSDVYNNNVPVVAEVNAALLPNWKGASTTPTLNHSITIIGYDDTQGLYYYTDTCGKTTHCNIYSTASDGVVHSVPQSTMWNAITNIPVNQSTGDGGWVW